MLKFILKPRLNHNAAIRQSIEGFKIRPGSSIFTLILIAMTLMVPILLAMISHDLQNKLQDLQNQGSSVVLYLDTNLSDSDVLNILNNMRTKNLIAKAELKTANDGMEFLKKSGVGIVINDLPNNLANKLLPAMIIINPNKNINTHELFQSWVKQFEKIPGVTEIQFDDNWMIKFNVLLNKLNFFSNLLILIILLVVGGIIWHALRYELEVKKEEINILKLIGASNAYIRLPYLYASLWYGLSGMFLAFILAFFIDKAILASLI